MSGNQWGPPPGQQYPPQQPPQPWQQGPGYGPPQPGAHPPYQGPPQGPYQGPPRQGPPFQGPAGFPGQPFQGQPQFGWGAPPGSRPPKKKGRGPLIAVLVLLFVLVVGVTALKAVSSALKGHDSSYSEPTTTSSYSPTEPTQPTEAPSTANVPTAQPTKVTTQPPRPTASRSTTTSTPTTNPGPSDSDLVLKNSLYKAGVMASVRCKESNARQSTVAGAKANYRNLLGCLNKAWAPMVAKAGGRFRAPHVLVFSGSVSSPCGTHYDSNPPFFCGTNDTIYMNLTEDMGNYNRYPQSYQKIWARMWMLHQFAHEYGHHVQNNMGMLQAYARIRYERPNYEMELQDSRRLELQASCFSDIFIGSNRNSYPVTGQAQFQWRWLIGHVTDLNNDHGDPGNHQYWALRGYNARNPRMCNTWAASAAKVQ